MVKWLLTIVFVPVATVVANSAQDEPLQHLVYVGVLLLSKILVFVMTIEVHRNPDTWLDSGPKFRVLLTSLVFIVLLVIALFVSMTSAGYYILVICVLKQPLTSFILWKWPSLETKW